MWGIKGRGMGGTWHEGDVEWRGTWDGGGGERGAEDGIWGDVKVGVWGQRGEMGTEKTRWVGNTAWRGCGDRGGVGGGR